MPATWFKETRSMQLTYFLQLFQIAAVLNQLRGKKKQKTETTPRKLATLKLLMLHTQFFFTQYIFIHNLKNMSASTN